MVPFKLLAHVHCTFVYVQQWQTSNSSTCGSGVMIPSSCLPPPPAPQTPSLSILVAFAKGFCLRGCSHCNGLSSLAPSLWHPILSKGLSLCTVALGSDMRLYYTREFFLAAILAFYTFRSAGPPRNPANNAKPQPHLGSPRARSLAQKNRKACECFEVTGGLAARDLRVVRCFFTCQAANSANKGANHQVPTTPIPRTIKNPNPSKSIARNSSSTSPVPSTSENT